MTNANFFTSGIGPDILMNALEGCITVFVWAACFFFLIFILSKSKGIQSGALLKMPTSIPSMEKFSLDIQKYISLKQTKTQLSKNTLKNTLKRQV